jgi:small subunit ribosomal protein S8
MVNDPIADLLTRVRNAVQARHPKVDVPPSRMKIAIVDLWKEHGFVKNYKLFRQGEEGVLRIYLKYVGKQNPVIRGLTRISRPGLRVYKGHRDIAAADGAASLTILSTPKGVLSDKVALENKVGGELLCKIW